LVLPVGLKEEWERRTGGVGTLSRDFIPHVTFCGASSVILHLSSSVGATFFSLRLKPCRRERLKDRSLAARIEMTR